MEPRIIHVGKGTIVVDNEDFLNGYQAGHIACLLQMKEITFTNTSLTEMIMEKLESMEIKEQYSIGYVVGYISTLTLKVRYQWRLNHRGVWSCERENGV